MILEPPRQQTELISEIEQMDRARYAGPVGWIDARQRREGWLGALQAAGVARGPEIFGDWSGAAMYSASHLRSARAP